VNEVIVVDQLTVDRALPAAVEQATGAATTQAEWQLPSFLPTSETGIPIYRAVDLVQGPEPTPRGFVEFAGAPADGFAVQLEIPTMEAIRVGQEQPLAKGAWAVFRRTEPNDYQQQTVQLLIRRRGAFRATGLPWTVGRPSQRAPRTEAPRVHIVYASRRQQCRAEDVHTAEVVSLGRLDGVLRPSGYARIGR